MVTADTISAAAALLDGVLVDVSSLDDAALVALQRALGTLTHTTARPRPSPPVNSRAGPPTNSAMPASRRPPAIALLRP